MKKILSLVFVFAFVLVFTSCVQDEPANSECDIEQCWLHVDDPEAIFYHAYDTLAGEPVSAERPDVRVVPSNQSQIIFSTRSKMDLSNLQVPLYFTLTPGAHITLLTTEGEVPFVNGTPVDLSATSEWQTERHFIVHSEDGQWQREYSVKINVPAGAYYPEGGFHLCFEDYKLEEQTQKYYVWESPTSEIYDNTLTWATGNPGFRLSMSSAQPEEYPSYPGVGKGVDGKDCVVLTTRSTGAFGKMARMPLAAGNFFVGTFDVSKALKNALSATRFGVPFAHKPLRMSGYYKYVPGQERTDKTGAVIEGDDRPALYAVVYRNVDEDGKQVQLDGADVKTNAHIIALAELKTEDFVVGEKGADINALPWQTFDVEFQYVGGLDEETLKTDITGMNYSMTMVFSSSMGGDQFQGAVGSTLMVDNVLLECAY